MPCYETVLIQISWLLKKLSDWLIIRSGHGILIYSAWQELRIDTVIIVKGNVGVNNRLKGESDC